MTAHAALASGDASGRVKARRGLPRASRAVFVDLAMWMVGLGVVVGAVFPLLTVVLGVPVDAALTVRLFVATVFAGLLVGGVNWWLARRVIGPRLRTLSGGMQQVAATLRHASETGDWSGCDDGTCLLPVDSDDELGDGASAFNALVGALADSHRVESAIRDLFQTLSSHLEVDRLAAASLDWVAGQVHASAGAFLVCRNDELCRAAAFGAIDDAPLCVAPELQAMLRTEAAGRAAVAVAGSESAWAVPLTFAEQPLGVIVLADTCPVSPEGERLLDLFRRAVAVSLHNALTYERSQQLAQWDPLTGCANRRSGMANLEEALAARSHAEVGVLMIDPDHFKRVNDAFGHLVGDQVLSHAARTIAGCLRSTDTLVRYGGEEFLAILPGAPARDLIGAARRITLALECSPITIDQNTIRVTVSVGAALRTTTDGQDVEDLLREADRALYAAKSGGRNRAVLAVPEPAHPRHSTAPA